MFTVFRTSARHLLLAALALGLTGVTVASAPGRPDRGYDTAVIVDGLERPIGITVDAQGDLYFTQVPTPGVPGGQGGSNRVSTWDRQTDTVSDISVGEPEPTFIEITRQGTLFWTCKSAGVILQHHRGQTSLVIDGLDQPSGIAVQDRGRGRGDVYFTQIPTPAVPGGDNNVAVLRNGEVVLLSMGEPEPTEVAVDRHGNLYWTCTTAGVILTRSARTGQISLLLDGLNAPVGIAVDEVGNLYFTEVPTPGVPGSQGGLNKVWKYGLDSGDLTLIDEGDPEPRGITASANGRNVYWTCTAAGVIVQARQR